MRFGRCWFKFWKCGWNLRDLRVKFVRFVWDLCNVYEIWEMRVPNLRFLRWSGSKFEICEMNRFQIWDLWDEPGESLELGAPKSPPTKDEWGIVREMKSWLPRMRGTSLKCVCGWISRRLRRLSRRRPSAVDSSELGAFGPQQSNNKEEDPQGDYHCKHYTPIKKERSRTAPGNCTTSRVGASMKSAPTKDQMGG